MKQYVDYDSKIMNTEFMSYGKLWSFFKVIQTQRAWINLLVGPNPHDYFIAEAIMTEIEVPIYIL